MHIEYTTATTAAAAAATAFAAAAAATASAKWFEQEDRVRAHGLYMNASCYTEHYDDELWQSVALLLLLLFFFALCSVMLMCIVRALLRV